MIIDFTGKPAKPGRELSAGKLPFVEPDSGFGMGETG